VSGQRRTILGDERRPPTSKPRAVMAGTTASCEAAWESSRAAAPCEAAWESFGMATPCEVACESSES
jgi:hypothetical protein